MPEIVDILAGLSAEKRLRVIPESSCRKMLDLSSNDYLGLGERYREFSEEFLLRFPDAAFSSSASRLLSSRQKYHILLESYLSSLYGKEILLFNSGYHANVGCIGALTLPSTLFICDKLIHASVVDGLRINSAEFKRFPHNDIQKLLKILDKESKKYDRVVVVVESVYSMDGDAAPLVELVALKNCFTNVMLYVDEAHAFGVRGERGLGLSEELNLINDIDILIGTFGKAAASVGAFAAVSEELKSLFINLARPFIFSTALPPVNVAWTLLMIEKITEMDKERRYLRELSANFSEKIEGITGKPTGSVSQIVPFLTGNAENALNLAAKLKEAGILALPIRRPTVPPGGERIRFSLSASMRPEDLSKAIGILRSFDK